MKRIRVTEFGNPEVMKLEEAPDLHADNEQVVVKIHATGVNPVDHYCRSGIFSWVTLPYTPGFDGAGIIKSVGPEVVALKPGDRVYTAFNITGTYADEVVCDQSQVYPLPDTVSFEAGAGVFIPYGTAYRALFQRCRVEAGECVLVHGAAGAVGMASVQMALAAGCRVIGTAGSVEGRKLVEDSGAHLVLDHYDSNHFTQALDWTKGRGVDVVVEPVADNIGQDSNILATGGRIAVIGDRNPVEINPKTLTDRDASIMGVGIGNLPPASAPGMHAYLYEGLKNGVLKPYISRKFSLAEAPRAHTALFEKGASGKIVLIP